MVTHVVIFEWKPGVGDAQIDEFRRAFDKMAAELADLARIQHGPGLKFRTESGDYGLVATFADKAAWEEYQAHPTHKAFVQDMVMPILAKRLTIQF